jgi:GrpB-like predicted nucleotidyltransferase (UPF0157 family)
MEQSVVLVPYDPAWPAAFEAEAGLLQARIGPWVAGGIHHVGSTSIPGLAAKPVIDIMVGVESLSSSRICIDRLEDLSYCYAPYRAEEMHWFCKPDPGHRTHHLHLVPAGSPRYTGVLAFRDYLRTHSEAAADYLATKERLAIEFEHDREAYTEGKSGVVARLTAEARRWATS